MPDYRLERPIINGKPASRWYVCWSDGRRSHRVSTKTDDKVKARSFLAQYAAIQDLPPERFTVGDLCDAYQKDREEDPSVHYPKAIANSLRHVKGHFGLLPPSMVSAMSVKSYTTQRRKAGVKDPTISKELRFLRQALKYGARHGWLSGELPEIRLPGEGVARERYLTREEFARLWFHSSPLHLRVFLALAISTAARGKHILALTWDRVDFDAGMVKYAKGASANKKTAPVPMNAPLRSILTAASHVRGKSGRVVEWEGKPVKSVRRAYGRACRLAGLEDAHRHDLRRTAASWALQGGASFDEVATMLGDSVEITRKHYAMFSADYLRGAVNNIAGRRA
jgi:integrase